MKHLVLIPVPFLISAIICQFFFKNELICSVVQHADGWDVCSGDSSGSGWKFSHTTHVPSAEHTLQRPQHNHNEEHHEHGEEDHSLPVCQSANHPVVPGARLHGRIRRLAGPNINADAEGCGAVGGARSGVLIEALVAQLLPLQPHRLLLLLVVGQLAQDFVAGGQSGGSVLRQDGGVTAEGAGEMFAAPVPILVRWCECHEARKTLEAEGVRAFQQLGCFEDIVICVVADGAFQLVGH